MSVINAVVARLVALSGSESEISPPTSEVYVFSSLTDADINFFERGEYGPVRLQQNTWAPFPKPLVVDSGSGETVMPVDFG